MKYPQNEPTITAKIPKSQAWEAAVSEGLELREQKDNSQWLLGALAERVTTAFGTSAVKDFSTSISVPYNSLREYRRVSVKIPPKDRIPHLSYRHHQLAANTDNPKGWLDRASDKSWTSEGMGIEISKSKGKEIKEVAPTMEKCEICDKWKPPEIKEKLLCEHHTVRFKLPIDKDKKIVVN